jgi:hypothetical protein
MNFTKYEGKPVFRTTELVSSTLVDPNQRSFDENLMLLRRHEI